jgi:hypothetical protein
MIRSRNDFSSASKVSKSSNLFDFRSKKTIQYKTPLERDFLMKTAYMDSVLDIEPFDLKVFYSRLNGTKLSYSANYLVHFRTTSLGEVHAPLLVKISSEIHRKSIGDAVHAYKIARLYANSQDWRFVILNETRIRDTHFDNIKLLKEKYESRFYHFDEQLANVILNKLRDMGHCYLDAFLAYTFDDPNEMYKAKFCLFNMIASKKIGCPMHEPFHNSMLIWVNDDTGFIPDSFDEFKQIFDCEINNVE